MDYSCFGRHPPPGSNNAVGNDDGGNNNFNKSGNFSIWGSNSGNLFHGGNSNTATTTMTANASHNNNNNNNNNNNMAEDTELAKEMNELSVQEREKIFDDIHGVAKVHEETPEFVSSCLQQLDNALLVDIPKKRRKALDRALFFKPSLQHDQDFKLMFLRADEFQVSKAANRMVNFFVHKQKLFGEEKLAKTITLEDLDEMDRKILSEGSMLILPRKDQIGRPIFFLDWSNFGWDYPINSLRCAWYLLINAVENNEIGQKKGMTHVVYNPKNISSATGKSSIFFFNSKTVEFIKNGIEMFTSLPVCVTSNHHCFEHPNDLQLKLLSIFRMAVGKDTRLRMKLHFGSTVEMQYSLLTYGIHCGKLLLQYKHYDRSREVLQQYLATRVQLEKIQQEKEAQAEQETGIILYPKPNDVLMGRGSPYQDYIGNMQWSRLIDSRLKDYRDCDNDSFRKTCVSMNAINTVKESYGGRFIQQTKEGWKIVDDSMARQKAASAFRSRIAKVTTTTTTTATLTPSTTTSMTII